MGKKILLIVAVLILLTGCVTIEIKEETTGIRYLQDSAYFNGYYVDKDSCVEYINYANYQQVSITPRFNQDGTLKFNDICIASSGVSNE